MLRALIPACLVVASALGAPARPEQVTVPAMKTGIYVGSVTLSTEPFVRDGDRFLSTYEAKVWPWVFWSESGRITITLSEADFDRLARGETVEFSGDALNHKRKPRKVTGRAQPEGSGAGKIKVRIHVDDVTLVFNGGYSFAPRESVQP